MMTTPYFICGFLPLLIGGALLFRMVFSMRLYARVPFTPSCGACAYDLSGLLTLRCPECGSDLRVVGIVTPQLARRGLPKVAAVVADGLIGAAFVGVAIMLMAFSWLRFASAFGPESETVVVIVMLSIPLVLSVSTGIWCWTQLRRSPASGSVVLPPLPPIEDARPVTFHPPGQQPTAPLSQPAHLSPPPLPRAVADPNHRTST